MIDASLNEVEGIAAKAARGAGLAWGLAEDTAMAARWLAASGLVWAPSLAALLEIHATLSKPASPLELRPALRGALLSPLLAGCYLDDVGAADATLALADVAYPLWLLPFAARNLRVVSWSGMSAAVHSAGCTISGDATALYAAQAARVTWQPLIGAVAGPAARSVRCARSAIEPADWQALHALGARTYVPASALSRTRGAGTAASDND